MRKLSYVLLVFALMIQMPVMGAETGSEEEVAGFEEAGEESP